MEMGDKSDLLEHPNGVPVQVDFVPPQPVPGGNRVGVMVVMPAVSETDECYPPVVGRGIPGLKPARPPNMRRRVDDPRRMKSHDGAEESAPQHQPESADSEQNDCEDSGWNKVVLREPNVDLVLGQIGDVAFQCSNVLAQLVSNKDPTGMRPPLAIARGVRVAVLVSELVMLAMRGHPLERAAFQGSHGANGEKVLKPLGCGER